MSFYVYFAEYYAALYEVAGRNPAANHSLDFAKSKLDSLISFVKEPDSESYITTASTLGFFVYRMKGSDLIRICVSPTFQDKVIRMEV